MNCSPIGLYDSIRLLGLLLVKYSCLWLCDERKISGKCIMGKQASKIPGRFHSSFASQHQWWEPRKKTGGGYQGFTSKDWWYISWSYPASLLHSFFYILFVFPSEILLPIKSEINRYLMQKNLIILILKMRNRFWHIAWHDITKATNLKIKIISSQCLVNVWKMLFIMLTKHIRNIWMHTSHNSI